MFGLVSVKRINNHFYSRMRISVRCMNNDVLYIDMVYLCSDIEFASLS